VERRGAPSAISPVLEGEHLSWLSLAEGGAPVMAVARMPDAFFDLAEHHLPPERYVGPAGGRPPIDNRSIVRVLWFVLATGCRWEDVPPELGCSGRSAHRFLQLWEEMGCWDRLHADLLRQLRKAG